MDHKPIIIKLESFHKPNLNLTSQDLSLLPIPKKYKITQQYFIHLPPRKFGGNHSHPTVEIMIGLGELRFYYLDENGKKQSEEMGIEDGVMKMFIVPSHLPHAVRNESKTSIGILYELATEKLYDVEKVDVLGLE